MSDVRFSALVVFALYEAVAVLFLVLAARMQRGTLRPNGFAGIRTPTTLRNPQAWYVGHRAAVPHFRWAAAVFAVAGLAGLVVGLLEGPEGLLAGLVIGASVLVVGVVMAAGVAARRAVLADQPEGAR